ncbi:hypothetical protein [Dactylosporangium sp. CA-139066]|uniref:hypothetical protein n=1 Tax=Dactylosporangium sp. CA-139066 TaxID=3239930 RepID=UPI003D8ED884
MSSSLITDPWRRLRRSAAMAAWFFTVFLAVPMAIAVSRNLGAGGNQARLWWAIGSVLILVAASVIGWFTWRGPWAAVDAQPRVLAARRQRLRERRHAAMTAFSEAAGRGRRR